MTGDRKTIMGILNLTDNSFLARSRALCLSETQLETKVREMLSDGAVIIDIGACSTAPGNEIIPEDEEWRRLERPLAFLFDAFPETAFSIDTFRSGIVRKALGLGRKFIVNDISAGEGDREMLPTVISEGVEYIAMDSTPAPYFFFESFSEKAERIGLRNWILDPGFGFGKTIGQNRDILHNLSRLKDFGRPVLVALSHKRMIYLPLSLTPDTCTEESLKAEKLAFDSGADIVRTHDIARLKRMLDATH